MFVQTEITPNPNSLKFLPGKQVSNDAPIEIINKNETDNELIRNILSIISTGISLATFLPGKNFKEFGLGVFSVCTNIILI